MNIQPTQIYQTNSYKPTFTHWVRDVKDPVTNVLSHRNDTCFFRDETFMTILADRMVAKYKDAQKVNVVCYGCSNGSEPYSLQMVLDSKYPKDVVDKFSIVGKDFDPVAIQQAKSNRFSLNPHEIDCINQYTNNNFDKFLVAKKQPMREMSPEEYRNLMISSGYYDGQIDEIYELRPEIKDKVNFEVADIRTDYKNIDPKNCVVLARNFWPYLKKEDQTELAQNLYKQLDNSSMLVVGGFDFGITDNISNAGFKTDGVRLIWEK